MTECSNGIDPLTRRVTELSDWSSAVAKLAEMCPERTTMSQIAFFLAAAYEDLKGQPTTYTDIKEDVGPVIRRTLHTTYGLFLDKPQRRRHRDEPREGLGWLTREMDPLDNRRKFLRLTETGRAVVAQFLDAVDEAQLETGASRMTISPFSVTIGDATINVPAVELTVSRT